MLFKLIYKVQKGNFRPFDLTIKEEMYNTMNSYYKYTSVICSKIIFLQNKYTYTAHQYWGKVSTIFHTFCL